MSFETTKGSLNVWELEFNGDYSNNNVNKYQIKINRKITINIEVSKTLTIESSNTIYLIHNPKTLHSWSTYLPEDWILTLSTLVRRISELFDFSVLFICYCIDSRS